MYGYARPRITAAGQPVRRRVPTRSEGLLRLQRHAGNHAVAGLVATQRERVVVQRAHDGGGGEHVHDDDGGGEHVHDDGGGAGGPGPPPVDWDDGRPPIAHRDHMIVNDLCLAIGAPEGAAFFENFSTRSQYALRDLAAKYVDAWTGVSRRRIAARMTEIARTEADHAMDIHHDWIRRRKARAPAEPILVGRQPHLRSNWGKKLAVGGGLAALAGGAAAATFGALRPGAVSGLLGKIGLNIPGVKDSPILGGAVAGGGALLAIGALAGLLGLGIWAGRKLTGKDRPRTPFEFSHEVSRAEAASNEAQARYETARSTGNAALAEMRALAPGSEPPGDAMRSYQHAVACGNEARNAREEYEVAVHAYLARLEPLRPIDEIAQYVIDTPGATLRSRANPNRPGEDAFTYATYLRNLVRTPDDAVPPRPVWPVVAGGGLPEALPEIGRPNTDPDWLPRVIARVKNVQRPVARDILRQRGVDSAQAAAMTVEQLASLLAGLPMPGRREQRPAEAAVSGIA